MCAGGVIHSIGDSQVIRFIGGLSIYIPFTSSSVMVSNFAVCGIPFLAGFYSKDYILEIFSMIYVNIFGLQDACTILQTGHITLSPTPDQQLENHSTKYHRQQPLYNILELLMMSIVVPETWFSKQ